MTQFQHHKILLIAIIFISGLFNPVLAQSKKKNKSKDTIVIYETIVVYDTLNVYDTLRISEIKKENNLKPLNAKTPEIIDLHNKNSISGIPISKKSLIKTATFSKNDINTSETQQKSEEMETDHFFEKLESTKWKGTKFGIVAGAGMWHAREIQHSISSGFIPIYNFGLVAEKPLKNHFSVQIGLNYSYLYNDMYLDLFDFDNCTIDGTNDSIFTFRQFSVPVKILYSLKWIQASLGLSYSYKAQNYSGKTNHALNICMGASIVFSDRIVLGINYTSGITNEFEMEGYSDDFWGLGGTSYSGKGKSRYTDLSLYYFLNGKKRQKTKKNTSEN